MGGTAGAPAQAEADEDTQAAPSDPGGDTPAEERRAPTGAEAGTDLSAPAGSLFEAAREDRPAELPSAEALPDAPEDAPRADAPAP
ncbi:MAG: hypothetical protein ACLFQF_09370, partial [Rhodosalinus sp.]